MLSTDSLVGHQLSMHTRVGVLSFMVLGAGLGHAGLQRTRSHPFQVHLPHEIFLPHADHVLTHRSPVALTQRVFMTIGMGGHAGWGGHVVWSYHFHTQLRSAFSSRSSTVHFDVHCTLLRHTFIVFGVGMGLGQHAILSDQTYLPSLVPDTHHVLIHAAPLSSMNFITLGVGHGLEAVCADAAAGASAATVAAVATAAATAAEERRNLIIAPRGGVRCGKRWRRGALRYEEGSPRGGGRGRDGCTTREEDGSRTPAQGIRKRECRKAGGERLPAGR